MKLRDTRKIQSAHPERLILLMLTPCFLLRPLAACRRMYFVSLLLPGVKHDVAAERAEENQFTRLLQPRLNLIILF